MEGRIMSEKKALTLGELAKRLGCEIHQAQYLVASRKIQPIQRAGNLRIFSEDVVKRLKAELGQRKQAKRLHRKRQSRNGQ